MSDAPTYELLAPENAELKRLVGELVDRIAELERQLTADSSNSSNSSRPPSSNAPWTRKPAKKRSSRTKSGCKPASSRARRQGRAALPTIPVIGWRSSRTAAATAMPR